MSRAAFGGELNLVAETARRAGHADVIRKAIDATVGE
ncbi:MAG: hypothetical protein DLM57_05700 [Pseudonocardiales bacterium]|nr:MAG: hypothetical protein DLM57_05700 [Pseudonocardiales bacterium]